MESTKDLNYYKNNCEEDYVNTPISVLRYITELEQALQLQQGGVKRCSCLPEEKIHKQDIGIENIEQMLIENIADFLDQEEVIIQESISGFKDPIIRENTELHIRMAKCAMYEYKRTVFSE